MKRDEILLAGITVRTSFNIESNWETGKIFPCVQRYFHKGLANTIPNRKTPETTYCAYTDYESDYRGAYTYFIGEEITAAEKLPEGLELLKIPPQKYAVLTTEPAPMPNVLRDAWHKIWETPPGDLGGKRRYHTDFEVYDERASDHNNVVLDLYIGIS